MNKYVIDKTQSISYNFGKFFNTHTSIEEFKEFFLIWENHLNTKEIIIENLCEWDLLLISRLMKSIMDSYYLDVPKDKFKIRNKIEVASEIYIKINLETGVKVTFKEMKEEKFQHQSIH